VTLAERVHRLYLKTLEARLGELVQASVSASFGGIRQGVMADVVASPDGGRFLLALDVAPTRGAAALSFPADVLRCFLDILLAKPAGAAAGHASITDIEIHVLRDTFEAFTGTLRKAWAPLFAIGFNRLSNSVDDARQILNLAPGEPVLIVSTQLRIAGPGYTFDLALPGFLVRVVEMRTTAGGGRKQLPRPAGEIVAGPLGAAVVELQAVLQGVTLRMEDLLALQPEQVLALGMPLEARFDCLVNGKPQFTGAMVAGGSHHCFQVETIKS
jgi:flagellar motor switch protein FliM